MQASFWNGDPDVDAIARFVFAPKCNFKKKYFPFFQIKISPFNSQNTFITRKIVEDYFLFPHIGRMDDIWAAYYITSKKYKVYFILSQQFFKKRNVHNYLTDFKNELLGYKNNVELIDSLYKNSDNIEKYLPLKIHKSIRRVEKNH